MGTPILTWAMADDDGSCPGDDGPCVHFQMFEADRFYAEQVEKPLRRVHKAYVRFVKELERAASKRAAGGGDGHGHVSVGLLWTEKGGRFAYLVEKEHGAHRDLYRTLLECEAEGIGHEHAHEEPAMAAPPKPTAKKAKTSKPAARRRA